MGRRSTHNGTELKVLILDAAENLIEAGGLASLSAREIAKRVGYSPGTIYNVFDNLDDVILHVEARLLDALADRLADLPHDADANRHVHALAHAYLAFTHAHPKLWNLLFEHHLPANIAVPDWYLGKLEALMSRVEAALTPLMPTREDSEIKRAARVLWAGVHGITSLSTADKLCNITAESAGPLVEDLVTNFLAGVRATNPMARCA